MGQGPHRNWSVVGCHAAKLSTSYQHGTRAQVRSAEGGYYTRGSGANNDDVDHVWLSRHERDLFRFNGHHPMSRGIEAP